jgi:hypothetical protein
MSHLFSGIGVSVTAVCGLRLDREDEFSWLA